MLRIVFMGTPAFAVPSLHRLAHADFIEIAMVVTKPDRKSGRGMKLQAPPVKIEAEKLGLNVYQPVNPSSEKSAEKLRRLNADLFVVVAYGKILKANLLSIPPKGVVNVHPSLLPKYRGTAPVQWAIINGESKTGVTVMYLDEGEDTGDIIRQRETEILPEDTAETLFERLSIIGANLLLEVLRTIDAGEIHRRPQNETEASHYPKLTKEHGHIDWNLSAVRIRNLIRGTKPWPGAYSILEDGRMIKIHEGTVISPDAPESEDRQPGEIFVSRDRGLFVKTGDGWIRIDSVQPEGKRIMSGADFVNGYRIKTGDRFK